MRFRGTKFIAFIVLTPACARASVGVEQIEANEGGYAAVAFGTTPTITPASGIFQGITFHAVDPTALANSYSAHAYAVGSYLYGTGAAGNPYVTDVYAADADTFFNDVVLPQSTPMTAGPIPGELVAGTQVINNSYVGATGSNVDALRRLDFIIQRQDVTFVAGAVCGGTFAGQYLDWSAYNSLAVSTDNPATPFSPTGSPGKTHADVWISGPLTSYATGQVSGYVAGLYGNAQTAGQADAQHDVVMRSLIMTGADKVGYTRDTANNLSDIHGAGLADFNSSLSTLQGGQQSIQSVVGGAITGTLATGMKGWGYGTVAAGGQSVMMFHSSGGITGITASLNWDVTSPSTSTTIDTTDADAPTTFPDINLDLRAVTSVGGQYVLGPSLGIGDPTLQSDATNDNVQYLYSTSTLPAGNYAFVMTGDPTQSPVVGFSYIVNSTATIDQWAQSTGGSWNSSGNWSNGVPNSAGAQANFLTSPTGLTAPGSISVNGNITVGEITFNDVQGYSINSGSAGTLTINDTGDTGGIYPSISVVAGNHSINIPVYVAAGLNVSTTTGNSLSISNTLTGVGGLITGGKGTVTLGGADNYGDTTVTGGTLTVNGSIASTNVTVAGGATLNANGALSTATALTANGTVNFAASSGTTVVARTLGSMNIGSGGLVTVGASANGNRTVLVTSGLVIAGSSGAWTGKLDLNDNDMIVKNGNLANIVSQAKMGFNAGVGYWNGSAGIVSSSAAHSSSFLTTLGVIQNDDGHGNPLYGATAPYGLFDGQNPGDSDILVKYTYYGDADLNGVVDGRDYDRIDIGYAQHLTGWANGDFNYDGVIDGSDYALIDNAFNQQGSSLSATTTGLIGAPAVQLSPLFSTTVPEPGTSLLFGGAAVAGIMCRRRRGMVNSSVH